MDPEVSRQVCEILNRVARAGPANLNSRLTPLPMAHGFVYLTAVIDVASRRALAWRVAITLEACRAVEALEQAFNRLAHRRS